MNLPKLLAALAILLFGAIGVIAYLKKEESLPTYYAPVQVPLEVELDHEIQAVTPAPPASKITSNDKEDVEEYDLPDADRIDEFFTKNGPALPIVETITYKSHVPWQKGRPAWLSDYAGHYKTSRHFIARSLNGKPDYLKQELAEGDKFNVLRLDKNFEFYLVVDTSRCRMWFYYVDLDQNEKVLLKTYPVGLGRIDSSKTSGLLTPLGKYSLGSRVATFKPKIMATHKGQMTEMITVFGTRWIPFEKEIVNCTLPAKGFGIHGTPWIHGVEGTLIDHTTSVGKYESDGCIRLSTPDIEELYAIIISRPAMIEIVKNFFDSTMKDD